MFSGLRRFIREHPVSVATWLVIVVGWEVLAHLAPPSTLASSPIVPPWEYVFTDALKSLAGNWDFAFWAPNPSAGGELTYRGALLAIGYHSASTMYRLIIGLTLGVILGVGTGLAVSYWAWVRRLAWTPLNLLRMFPLLAAIPLFQFWLGANLRGTTVFISFGVWVLIVVATIHAVKNVPDRYIESARMLGASRRRTYLTVVVPGSMVELRTGLLLAAGLSWSLTVGSEYIGLPSGLGSILAVAVAFTNTGRMIIIAVLISMFALLTFLFVDRFFRRMVRWMPQVGAEGAALTRVAGAAAIGGAEAMAIEE
jgi:ABC-type nitrate/sulfonate/bicarbonate transport system permease component